VLLLHPVAIRAQARAGASTNDSNLNGMDAGCLKLTFLPAFPNISSLPCAIRLQVCLSAQARAR